MLCNKIERTVQSACHVVGARARHTMHKQCLVHAWDAVCQLHCAIRQSDGWTRLLLLCLLWSHRNCLLQHAQQPAGGFDALLQRLITFVQNFI